MKCTVLSCLYIGQNILNVFCDPRIDDVLNAAVKKDWNNKNFDGMDLSGVDMWGRRVAGEMPF